MFTQIKNLVIQNKIYFGIYIALVALVGTIFVITLAAQTSNQPTFKSKLQMKESIDTMCETDDQCGNGKCEENDDGEYHCICNEGYISHNDICDYEQYKQLTTFLISFFAGTFGVDWFYLSDGNGGYIVGGIFKCLTLGGAGIWTLVDIIRLIVNVFLDGNGIDLLAW